MRQNRRSLLAHSAALALSLVAVTGAGATEKVGAGGETVRQAIVLRMSVDGEMFQATALVGEPTQVRTRAGSVLQLVPTLAPATGEGVRPVAIEVYERIRTEGADLANLIEVVPLPAVGEGSATAATFGRTIQIEPVELREITIPAPLTGSDSPLRPIQCCITCGEAEICAFCVHMSCGVCCSF